jgi:hypothetical protein
MKTIYIFLAVLIITSSSCTKSKNTTNPMTSYIVVGQTGGFTQANARATYFMIANGQLKQDTTQPYYDVPATTSGFNFSVTMPDSLYRKCADVTAMLPPELLQMNHTHIGTQLPDAGYTDVRTTINGVDYQWFFEQDQSTSSQAVQNFVSGVRAVGY